MGIKGIQFFTTDAEIEIIFWVLVGIASTAFVLFYASYRYRRWHRYKEFEDEMRSLDLDREQEGTFAAMIKRYRIGEPVQILYDLKRFDDLASAEMRRILGSPGSAEAKENFINALYDIRMRTYNADWVEQGGWQGVT